jgi:hypothetical protein
VTLWELNVIAHCLNARPRIASILPRPWKSIYNYVIINGLPWNLSPQKSQTISHSHWLDGRMAGCKEHNSSHD